MSRLRRRQVVLLLDGALLSRSQVLSFITSRLKYS